MPASLYRLAGKPHHTEVLVRESQANVSVPAEVFSEKQVETLETHGATEAEPVTAESLETSETTTGSDPTLVDEPAAPDSSQEEVTTTDPVVDSTPTFPQWEPTWTKSQLLDVALQLSLNVTIANTKAEIVAALTAATS